MKPRSHVLVEPYKDLYFPWLRPLVEASDSRYHLRDWDEPDYWDPAQYVSEGLLPKNLGTQGTNMNCNNAILIVANLVGFTLRKGAKASDLVKRIVDMIYEMQSKIGFHACGPVRVLMWIPGLLKKRALPYAVSYRGRLSLKVELACHVEEIVRSADEVRDKEKKRPEFLDIASSIQVIRKMEKNNIHIPILRQNVIQKRARELLEHADGTNLNKMKDQLGRISTISRAWHREMEQLEKDFCDGKFRRFSDESVDTKSYSPEYARLMELQRNWRHNQKNMVIMEDLFQEQDVIDSLERDACSDELDALEREAKWKEVTYFNERFNTRLEHESVRVRAQFKHHRDERRAFFQDPPLLMWDRRLAEPVIAHENEIHPTVPFSLLDFQPHPPDLYPLTKEQIKQGDLLMMALFESPDKRLSSLDVAAPGAYNAIVPKVPALRDPLRGGRRDVSLLQPNMLTHEMMYEIVKAWDEWPHKPSLAQLVYHTGLKQN